MRQVQIVDTKRLELNVRPKMFRCPCPTVTERRQPSTLFVACSSSESDTQLYAQATPIIDYKVNVNQMLTKKTILQNTHKYLLKVIRIDDASQHSTVITTEKQSNERYVTDI